MAIILSIVGIFMAVWTWQNVHPIVGVIVGFLFIGGAGWRMLGGLVGLGRPSSRQAFGPEGKQFIAAWEARFGEMRPGRPETQPPPNAFQAWLREYKATGISAGEWLDKRH